MRAQLTGALRRRAGSSPAADLMTGAPDLEQLEPAIIQNVDPATTVAPTRTHPDRWLDVAPDRIQSLHADGVVTASAAFTSSGTDWPSPS